MNYMESGPIDEIILNTPVTGRPIINCNGTVDHMTAEQFRRYLFAKKEQKDQAPHPPTQEERLSALEAKLSAYESAYREGVNNA